MTRRAVLAASIAALIAAVLIAVSGGFITFVGGVRVSSRSSPLPFAVAAALLTAWLVTASRRGAVRDDLAWLERSLESRGRGLASAISLCTLLAALSFATYSPSGSDASGYLSQAQMWSHLETRLFDPLPGLPDWPLGPSGTTPLGWRASLERGWQVPTYAPGLPWLMAIPHAVGGTAGAVSIVVIAAAVAVLAASAVAWRLSGGTAAVFAALLLSTSPTFLIHAFQPMSDVPVTAAWTLCWWLVIRRSALFSGIAAAVAVAIRPNLAPLAAIPLVVVLAQARGVRVWSGALFSLPVACAGALIAFMQWRWYGSPLTSGYGSAEEIFSTGNLAPNVQLYAAWMWQAEPAVVVAAAAALAVSILVTDRSGSPGRDEATAASDPARALRRSKAALLTFAAGVIVAYLVYAVFEVWTYVRFLLPAVAVIVAVTSAEIADALRRLPPSPRATAIVGLALAIMSTGLHTARTLGVFQIAAVTARARDAGTLLNEKLGARAVMLASEQSGSMRYLTGRPIVRWDALDVSSLRTSLAILDAHGYEVWWVLDQFEEPLVRRRFAGVPEAALDRTPDVEAGPLMRTRAWRVPKHRTP